MEKSAALSPQALAFAGLKCNLITTDKLSREKHHPWDKRKIIRKHQFDFDGIKKEPSRKAPFYKDCGKRGCPENDKLEGQPQKLKSETTSNDCKISKWVPAFNRYPHIC